MSVYDLWNNKDGLKDSTKIKTALSSEWTFKSPRSSPRSTSPPPPSRAGEAIFNEYNELIYSKTNVSTDAKQLIEPLEKPFDFYDDEELAFGINLLKNNVACVGENITKLIQMCEYLIAFFYCVKYSFYCVSLGAESENTDRVSTEVRSKHLYFVSSKDFNL